MAAFALRPGWSAERLEWAKLPRASWKGDTFSWAMAVRPWRNRTLRRTVQGVGAGPVISGRPGLRRLGRCGLSVAGSGGSLSASLPVGDGAQSARFVDTMLSK